MSTKIELLTPVGRIVQGSLYSGQTTDAENRPLVYKTGANAGQPRVNFWFALALPKKGETHWNQTDWGKKIWEVGHAGFPNGQANSPSFAWKVIDGDSMIPNTQGNRPCDHEGFAGNWVLKYSGSFAPSLFNETGTLPLTEPNAIQLGDYIQVYGYVDSNNSTQQPGVYLNHSMVARSGFGQRILVGADPKSVGFGNCPLPAGASLTPVSQAFNATADATSSANVASSVPTPAAPPVQPYPNILTPPIPISPVAVPPPAPQHVLTALAQGATYEQLIGTGWTDATLIQHGLMQA